MQDSKRAVENGDIGQPQAFAAPLIQHHVGMSVSVSWSLGHHLPPATVPRAIILQASTLTGAINIIF